MRVNQTDSTTKINLLLFASGFKIACKCAYATSLMSTTGNCICGMPGKPPIIIFFIISPDENLHSFRFGPSINPGLIVTNSNL